MKYLLLFPFCVILSACGKESNEPLIYENAVDEEKIQEQREMILGVWQVQHYAEDKNRDGIIEEAEKISVDSITVRLSYSADGTLRNSIVDHRNAANDSTNTGSWEINTADIVSHITGANPSVTNDYEIIELTDTSFIVQEEDGIYRTVTKKL